MALRSGGRKLSFDVLNGHYGSIDEEILLYRSVSEPVLDNGVVEGETSLVPADNKPNRRKRKNKGSKTKKKNLIEHSIYEDPITEKRVDAVFDDDRSCCSRANGFESDYQSYRIQTVICEEITVSEQSPASVRTVHQVSEPNFQILHGDRNKFGELRQRNLNGSAPVDESVDGIGEAPNGTVKDENSAEFGSSGQQDSEFDQSFVPKLETAESLDWKQIMSKDSCYHSSLERSPVKYFMEEIYSGNTLRNTTTLGNEKDRERVYDTIFRLPWRCELLIDVGFFVCLDSFLSLLTIMPVRILMILWRSLRTRQFQRPCAAELSDFGCFIVLVCGVTLLQQTDISLIYHMIRGQGTIKLYVVYNVLEIFDRLCQNIGGDMLQTMFSSAKGLASSPPEDIKFWLWRFLSDEALTVVASVVHSFVLLAQAITLSTCIVAHNNALLALLVSNNFAEIKSNVFKRFSKDNIHSLVYYDSVERFHISAFILFVLAQNILEAEGPWFGSFLANTLLVFVCEIMIDVIKHSFIAKFNEVKPIAYSEFLEALCKQTLNCQPEDGKKSLTFIPLAPACVVIRVLTPVYAVHLPCGPFPWRLLWVIFLSAITYVMLVSLKVLIAMGLHKHAIWYVDRCQKRKHHLHFD